MPSAPSIRIEYRPSRWQRVLSTGLVVLTALALVLAPWPIWLRLIVVTLYLGSVAYVVRRLRGPPWHAVAWSSDGAWTLATDAENERPASLREARLFGPLVALRLQTGSECRRVLLWPDSAAQDDLRRLRIRLSREIGRVPDEAK